MEYVPAAPIRQYAWYFFGGGAVFDFALALCIGVVVGTYSSIFVATPVALFLHREKKAVVTKKSK